MNCARCGDPLVVTGCSYPIVHSRIHARQMGWQGAGDMWCCPACVRAVDAEGNDAVTGADGTVGGSYAGA